MSTPTHTPLRTVRVPDELWTAAQIRAQQDRRSLSDVIRVALEAYARPESDT